MAKKARAKTAKKKSNLRVSNPPLFKSEEQFDDFLPGDAYSKLVVGRRSTRSEIARIERLLSFEHILWTRGLRHIAGVDEVGLGALAGPVVAAAVIFPPHFSVRKLLGVNDSKKLTPLKRDALNRRIQREAVAIGIGMAEVNEIAELNIFHAGQLAMRRAVSNLTVAPEHVLLDGRPMDDFAVPHNCFIKGDALNFSIAAASIVAKVYRDELMTEFDKTYPQYGFGRHKGYGTEAHWEALKTYGTSPIHRSSYERLRELSTLEDSDVQEEIFSLRK